MNSSSLDKAAVRPAENHRTAMTALSHASIEAAFSPTAINRLDFPEQESLMDPPLLLDHLTQNPWGSSTISSSKQSAESVSSRLLASSRSAVRLRAGKFKSLAFSDLAFHCFFHCGMFRGWGKGTGQSWLQRPKARGLQKEKQTLRQNQMPIWCSSLMLLCQKIYWTWEWAQL
jgi:hypothetical protein